MSVLQILVLAVVAIVFGQVKSGRPLALLAVSTFSIYWLQPVQSPANLTFWLPTFTLLITIFSWRVTMFSETIDWKQNIHALAVIAGVIVLMGANRYLEIERLFITETPRLQWIGITIAVMLSATAPIVRSKRLDSVLVPFLIFGLIALLVTVKVPSAMTALYQVVLSVRGKVSSVSLTSFSWLGFSYVTFRLLHTALDRRAGRLSAVSLGEYVNYIIFFPAFVAGPIDRVERFVQDLNTPVSLERSGWLEAGSRFFAGLFKKFVLADGLAWIALNETFARDIHSTGWMWLLLYMYSLRIYFDFSAYTDIAIGLGRFLGIRLPENFSSPYLKPNVTMFWNSWHMTLTQWFRSYFSNPLMRALRTRNPLVPVYIVILITQIGTMVLIGLWHGITMNFVWWGLWHGVGLFIQNRWSEFVRPRLGLRDMSHGWQTAFKTAGVFVTFNFVSLSWLFFTLPTPELSWNAMAKLFGVN